ncbi:MAG: PPC domain-containing protein [Chloroflexi bacterium]|nr:PPC domain-containing protein [Chloroflexota bacterium]
MTRKFIVTVGVLIAVLMSVAGIAAAQATEEPPKEAQAERTALTEGTITAFLEGTSTFPFSAELGEVIVFSLNSDAFDPYLEILNADGDSIASDDDSGPSTNSLLVFTAPENGEYSVLVRPFSEGATGDFSLSMVKTISAISEGAPDSVQLSDSTPVVRALTATSEAYSIALSGDEAFDAAMALFDPDGYVVDQTESFQVQVLQLPKTMLEVDRLYYLVVVPYAGQDVSLTLEVTPAEFLTLSAEPQPIEFLADQYEDAVLINVTEGERYLLTVSADYPVSLSASIDGYEIDTYASLSLSGAEGGSIIFTAGGTGTTFVRINNNSYYEGDSMTVYLSIRPME